MATDLVIPPTPELLWPTLEAVRDLGGSGSIDEIVDRVLALRGFTEDQQAVLHGDGPKTELEYRLAWARTYLKRVGLLVNSERSVWSLSDDGKVVKEAQIGPLYRGLIVSMREARRARQATQDGAAADLADQDLDSNDDALDWRDQLLESVMSMSPDGFERLAQRLLREAGFISAAVTGRSGDGGIDGLGVYRLSLISFPVFFQCKRYRGSVSSGAVRDFRGAMAGRGDKGLLITTGTFTAEAKAEATRDGAPPIDLIDGNRLCELLRQYELGVQRVIRQVEDVAIDVDFFRDL